LFKPVLLTTCCLLAFGTLRAQFTLAGQVFDSSRINPVEGVRVISTSGLFTVTDTVGRYSLRVMNTDSVTFFYRNKPTLKFAVSTIPDPAHFNISLHVTVKGKYRTMKEVIVYGKSYRQDSMENRETYGDVFDFRKPGVRTSVSPDGVAGADVNEIINMFRFKRNKRLRAFQLRLESQEKEKYVNYRFSKTHVRRITGLEGTRLDSFMIRYRPDYEFVSQADDLVLDQYILNASYRYKVEMMREEK